jgi:RNA polymerase sigma-70 factor (ECF subfamily)
MHTTPVSLLQRLQRPAEQQAWARFVQLYTPLLYYWACRLGLQAQDASDLVQDVLTLLVRKLPDFHYERGKSFRAWLRTVTLNQWRNNQRRRPVPVSSGSDPALANLASPDDADALEEAEYRQYLVSRALQLMQVDFAPTTWKAFWEHMVAGRPAAEVAAELGIRIDSVYAAKSRVLRRLRQELDGLLE